MLIAQISDCHITAPGERVADHIDPAPALRQAVARINALSPDLVVGTGDLVNDGRPDEYDELESILAELRPPFVPLPGNHDDRAELRARFASLPAGAPSDPIDHVVDLHDDLGRVRIVCLDTTIPGRHDGRLTPDQLEWLDATLSEGSGTPTVVAQHHPPVPAGIPSMDRYGLTGADGEAQVISRHPHVIAIIAGHYHRSFHQRFAGSVVTCCPSTAVQLALDFTREHALYCDEPTGFMLHRIDGPAAATSHLVPVAESATWTPSWAQVTKGDGPQT